ncbi:tetratricopeptide repeat protein 39B isoform X2 [Helicoverpa armigera]|uniref:tetratricopeptide repeat protein 39B isoform X2 n=1 Tax=Helicoverpa armigera TaxID=29058 RepID=UPI003083587E
MALRQETAPALTPPLLHDPFGVAAATLADEHFEDEFEDATDELPPAQTADLHTSFEDCEVAIRKFFNNDLIGATNMMKPWERTSLYHSLGTAMFEFIPAMLTFDHAQINRTLAALKVAINICNQHRKNYTFVESIGTIIKKPNYATYTDLEAHAELCYAEALLLQAAMTIMDGEDLTGLIKGTIKVKNCYTSYKECAKILEKKEWETELSRVQFRSGVRLGIATFNVMISMLPPKIISVLEFVGFSGNKTVGLAELEAGSNEPGMRSVLCDLTLLGYHLVMCHFIGAPGDLPVCERILDRQLKVYPQSVWFLMFKGRIELLRGQFDAAIETYNRSINSQKEWCQFHHVCYWEIMWVNRNASYYKQRIAGKSLPMEKFVIKRCARYQAQGGRLLLPAIELLCLWNMFPILAKNERNAQNVLKLIEATSQQIERDPCDWMAGYEIDNRALLWFLQGCCLAAMNLPRLALDSFSSVLQLKNHIKEDTFLLPYTVSEMAMCHYQLGDKDRALQMLQDARKKYSGYSLESRLHFRLHSKLEIVKNGTSTTASPATS